MIEMTEPSKADRTRTRILLAVRAEPCSTTAEIAAELKISRTGALQHLTVLRSMRLVESRWARGPAADVRIWWCP